MLDLAVLGSTSCFWIESSAPSPPAPRWSAAALPAAGAAAPRLAQRGGLLLQRSLVFFSSSCWLCSSVVRSCDCFSSPSVRMLAAIVLSTMPIDSMSWSRKAWWVSLKR
jgi:hypothetical protein